MQQRIGSHALGPALLLVFKPAHLGAQGRSHSLALADAQQGHQLGALPLILCSGDRLGILFCQVGEFFRRAKRRRNGTDVQNEGGGHLPAGHGLLIGGQAVPLLGVAHGQACRAARQRVGHTAREKIPVHLLLRGHRQLHRTATRTNRDQHIRGRRSRQQPDGVRGRLLDGLE